MATSGLVLDVYDDFQGNVLRSVYPTQEALPENVKLAHALSAAERRQLPDDVFALVLIDGDTTLRKYACIDSGNTTLAVEFFLKTGHKLPAEAQKIAAENLLRACDMYELEVPEALQKIAVLGALLTALPAFETAAAVPSQIRQNLAENQLLGSGGHVVTDSERSALRGQMGKFADVTGTDDMPLQAPPTTKPGTVAKTVILKSAASAMAHLVSGEHSYHGGENSVEPDDNLGMMHGEGPKKEPQMKALRPHVDVSNKQPPTVVHEKKAELYALPSLSLYPLDNYKQVAVAAQYYEKYASDFSFEHRREYCVNLVKRANDLGIPVSNEARSYGATTWAESDQIKVGHLLRRNTVEHDADLTLLLDTLYEKRASLEPELFAATLHEFDKVAHLDFGYGQGIPDPYASTFGVKIAEEWSEVIGNDMVTAADLHRLGKIGMRALKATFSEDFAMSFKKSPISVFKSLPLEQKKIVMRMATDNSGPGIELMA